MQELMKGKLYSFDEKVRVEQGPQIVELECTDKNLDNKVTHANYQIGKIDAFGKKIAKGEKMNCVDWKAKLAPLMWKVYQWQLPENLKKVVKDAIETGRVHDHARFIQINQFEDKDKALTFAETTYNSMVEKAELAKAELAKAE